MNLFELVEILQRVRGVDRKIQRKHSTKTKVHRNVNLVHKQYKKEKRIKEQLVAVSAGWAAAQMWMGKALQHTEDALGNIPFSRGPQSL